MNRTSLTIQSIIFAFTCPVFLLAQSPDSEAKKYEHFVGLRSMVAPAGLLGDMTNNNPGFGAMYGLIRNTSNANLSYRAKIATDIWWNNQFKGTDERTRVSRFSYTLGLMYFFGEKPESDNRTYIGFEAGVTSWYIDYPLDNLVPTNHYYKPQAAICYGWNLKKGWFIEIGLEGVFLDKTKIAFKEYNDFSVALSLTLGMR